MTQHHIDRVDAPDDGYGDGQGDTYGCTCGETFDEVQYGGAEEAFAHLEAELGRKSFVLVKVEGGIADPSYDPARVDLIVVDYDVSESTDSAIEELETMIADVQTIPDDLAALPHDDPRWLDKAGILASLTEDLDGLRAMAS